MRNISAAIMILFLLSLASAQRAPKPSSLDDLRFLIGEWEGVGEGGPGSGKGAFSFAFDLQNQTIPDNRTHSSNTSIGLRGRIEKEDTNAEDNLKR